MESEVITTSEQQEQKPSQMAGNSCLSSAGYFWKGNAEYSDLSVFENLINIARMILTHYRLCYKWISIRAPHENVYQKWRSSAPIRSKWILRILDWVDVMVRETVHCAHFNLLFKKECWNEKEERLSLSIGTLKPRGNIPMSAYNRKSSSLSNFISMTKSNLFRPYFQWSGCLSIRHLPFEIRC